MKGGQEDRFRVLRIVLQLSFTLIVAGLAAGVAGLSYLKTIYSFSGSGHPGGFAAWILLTTSPLIRCLQSKSLWELAPAFQIGTPFSASNVSFWISVFILVRVIKIAAGHFQLGPRLGYKPGSILGPLWRSRESDAAPITNYVVMINGSVTNSITAQTVGAANQQALTLSTKPEMSDGIASDLERLLNAITSDSRLPEDKKREASDLVRTIAEEAKRPEKERKPAVIKAILNAVPAVISTAKSLVDLWTEIQPHLASFFL